MTSGTNNVDDIVQRIRQVVGNQQQVALHEPDLGEYEKTLVMDCLDSGWISSVGQYVDRFEREIAEYTGVKHAVAVVNGTAALHVSLLLAGVTADDEVLCPALTFIATPNAIRYCQAIPHFLDVAADTWGICPVAMAEHLAYVAVHQNGETRNRLTGRRIAAVVPMHTFGTPVDMDPLIEVCGRYRLPIVEDAAESLGSTYKGRQTGSLGLLAAVSFNGNKIITAGGGGVILTNDTQLAQRGKHLTTTAKLPHRWEFHHDQLGFNYRMPNLNAALAVAQLSRLTNFIAAKRQVHANYLTVFEGCAHGTVYSPPSFAASNHWLNALTVHGGREHREQVLATACDAGIAVRPAWQLVSQAPMYRDCPSATLTISQELAGCLISLPSSPALAKQQTSLQAA